MIGIPVPYEVQRATWEKARALRTNFADRLTLQQNIEMEVLLGIGPTQLGWNQCGAVMCLDAIVKMRSGK